MEQQRLVKFRRLLVLGALPVLGGFSLGVMLLDRYQKSASSSVPASVATAPVPKPRSVVVATDPSATPETSVRPSPKPVNPATLTPQQKALNQRAKQAFTTSAMPVDSLIEMQVAIAEGVSSLPLVLPNGADIVDTSGHPLGRLQAGASYTTETDGQVITLAGQPFPSLFWVLPPVGGTFQLGDRVYRGKLLLAVHKGNLWAVNHINLRQYLYSVVGSEVSASWHMEALKAQAVAARSYALTYYFRRVSPLYHLGATEYYQVYSGIQTEADRIQKAVDATAGEFVSHRGGIVESLYAASDDIVADAFQGRGMSQLGALKLAEQGYSYRQILSNYYPTTGVGQIVADMN